MKTGRVVDLADLQQIGEETDRKRHDPHFVSIHNHDPVLDKVGLEALLPDKSEEPVDAFIQVFVV